MDNVAFSEFSQAKLKEMLGCLGKVCPNTIAMIKLKESGPGPLVELDKMDEAMRIANRRLARAFQEDSYLPIPLGVGQIGLAIRVPLEADSGSRPAMWDLLEEIQAELGKSLGCQAVIGIGRSYERIEDLRVSYHEALNAQEFAERHEERGIVHVDSIRELKAEAEAYPLKAKEKLLASIKVGDAEGSRQAFSDFMAQFSRFIAGKPEVLKVRLYELLGSMIDAAILGGGDEKKLNELVGESFNDIAHLKDAEIAEKWLSRLVVQIAGLVAHVHEKRSKSIVRNAILYMEENFRSPLSYRDVAKEVFVSPSYFLSLFKQETGQTFVDYITSIRMEKAKALLASTEKSVMEIADEVGFGNANYFSSSFKKATGMTPKEYRAKTSSRPAPDMLSD